MFCCLCVCACVHPARTQVPDPALIEQPRLCCMVADVAGGPASCWATVQTQLSLAVGHTVEVCHNLELELFSMCTAGERRLFVERDSSRHRAEICSASGSCCGSRLWLPVLTRTSHSHPGIICFS